VAKTKAEIAEEAARYESLLQQAQLAAEEHRLDEAVKFAAGALEYSASWVKVSRQSSDAPLRLAAFEVVVHSAPLTFDGAAISELDARSKELRRIQKHLDHEIATDISNARRRLQCAHRLWKHIETAGEIAILEMPSALGIDKEDCRTILETWLKMRLLRRSMRRSVWYVSPWTQFDAAVRAKCSECGTAVSAPKEKFLREQRCPKCQQKNHFCIIGEADQTDS
jgi:hypothetical protein